MSTYQEAKLTANIKALLADGPKTAKAIGTHLQVPFRRVYRVVKGSDFNYVTSDGTFELAQKV